MGSDELPRSLRRLWGEEPGPRPGQRPSLDVQQVARAAIELADDRGLGAVSMSRVASALGVTTMALYRYVENKAELLELMLEVAAGDPPPLDPSLDWRDALRAWAEQLSHVYVRHPWLVQVPVQGPPRGPHQLAWAEQGMAALEPTSLRAQERLETVLLLLVYLRGEVALQKQLAGAGATEPAAEAAYVATLGDLDADRFPNLAALLDDAPPDEGEAPDDEAPLSFGLERILDGVELLVRRRRRNADASARGGDGSRSR